MRIDAGDPLTRLVLTLAPVCDAPLEAALTAARAGLLRRVGDWTDDQLALACLLARQGWINDYAWTVGADEARLVADLRALSGPQAAVALAMYEPLPGAPLGGSGEVMAVVAQQVEAPAVEAGLRAKIARVGRIEGATSRAVQAQYEEHPYPRWVVLPGVRSRAGYGAHVARLFPQAARLPDRRLDVLVAGCGTGQHPLELARAFCDIEVTAIDLSLASLAYAARMGAVLGVGDVTFVQADLLEVAALGRDFDVIESAGVLHHLADMWVGWRALLGVLRPGGVMMVSLYSHRARADVRRARAWIAEQGFTADGDGIRACRQAMRGLDESWARNLAASLDFASVSGCRDLLFHVRESDVTLPALSAFIAAEGLELLGVETPPAIARAFRRWAGDEDAMCDLTKWDAFEAENLDCFASMIHLWVRRTGG